VGGDFYDLFASGTGWIVVVGDVCGKGPQAAQLTGLMRHTVRALAMQNPMITPSQLMTLLNDVLRRRDESPLATLVIARVSQPEQSSFPVILCSAGHPPTLHRQGSQVRRQSSTGSWWVCSPRRPTGTWNCAWPGTMPF
jgi:phosphoserine phosphatase RsbU/P